MEFNLADLFEAVADTVGEREAVVCGEHRLSYARLDERASRLADALSTEGVGPGDHVGLWLYNGPEYLEAMLAAFKLRAVPINVNYRYVEEELVYLFTDADLRAVVHEPELAPLLDSIRPRVPMLATTVARGEPYEEFLAGGSPNAPAANRSSDDIYIVYTGGTTGMPKGVEWRHEDILFGALEGVLTSAPLAHPEDVRERARQGGFRCLPASPFMHGSGHWLALATLLHGGTVVIAPDRRFDPVRLWQLVADEAVNFLGIVGDAFARPMVEALEAGTGRWDLSALTYLLSAGAILSPSIKDALVALLPSTLVIDGFGASETGGQGAMIGGAAAGDARPRFVVNDETKVLDDDLRPVLPGSGVVGRLARRGHVPLGYHKDPERSAATFPVVDGARWAVPGDMATVEADGAVTLLGRGSVSINTGGEKVYPEEVEAVLKAHPEVFDALVVGVPDQRWGERVVAVVQPRQGDLPSLADLAAHCRRRLAAYKVPRGLLVVDEVVRAPSGKPDYRWAREAALAGSDADPAPTGSAPGPV